MNASYFSSANSYLNVQWGDSRPPWLHKTSRPFITFSRESGSGGTGIARALARRLNVGASGDENWTVFEGNLVNAMLKENNLSPQLGRFLPEDRIPEFNSSLGEWVGLHPNLWDLTQKTVDTTMRLARGGNVILVGRGANFATANIPGGIHIRLVAPPEYRARQIAQLYGLTEREAFHYNHQRDGERRRFVAAVFGKKELSESLYDLVFNTSRISPDEVVQQVMELVKMRIGENKHEEEIGEDAHKRRFFESQRMAG